MFAAAALAGCADQADHGLSGTPLSYPAQTGAWSFAGGPGAKLTTEHYDVFTTLSGGPLRSDIPGFLEACRASYVDLTGLAEVGKGRKLPVYLFATRQQWAALTSSITGPAASTYLKVESGGYCYSGVCVYWDIGPTPTFNVAAHEGMHQFLHLASVQALPIWAEEGLASLAEGFRVRGGLVYFRPEDNNSRRMGLRKLILTGRWRPAERLIGMNAADNIQENPLQGGEYYSQLWALLLMIRSDSQYSAGLGRLLRDAAEGRMNQALGFSPSAWAQLQRNPSAYTQVVGAKAFAHYIDADPARFERRYLAFSRKLAMLER